MTNIRVINLSLKYFRFIPPDCKDVRIRKFEFVAKIYFFMNKSVSLTISVSHYLKQSPSNSSFIKIVVVRYFYST